jgi:hypothetical protein
MSTLFQAELNLPVRGVSQRVTRRPDIAPGETEVLFNEAGPGCIRHWWLTYTPSEPKAVQDRIHDLRLRVYYDDTDLPGIDLTLGQFFAIMLGQDIYEVHSAALTVLPKNALNCYLPMPFGAMRMELENQSASQVSIWFMADWHAYPAGASLTPLRLTTYPHTEHTADAAGSYLMADIVGEGFFAGMTKAVRVHDESDAWFHTGGDLWLLDGETYPHPLRGIGGEDVFNMSFGVWEAQAPWVGTPYLKEPVKGQAGRAGYECVNYRFFGPDPIWFDTSAVVRFGSKANDLETVVYAYVQTRAAPAIRTPDTWMLAGPFRCYGESEFHRREWAEEPTHLWPENWTPGFGQYVTGQGNAAFAIPISAISEHGWCDFARHFRGRKPANIGTQPVDVAAYAVGKVHIGKSDLYNIYIGYDDRLSLWINGEPVITGGYHAQGFAVDHITWRLPAGEVEIRVKLSNEDNYQWRLWAFHVKIGD